MSTWIASPTEGLFRYWHLLGHEAKGFVYGACGQSYRDGVERRDDLPPENQRCPTCHGVYAAELQQRIVPDVNR